MRDTNFLYDFPPKTMETVDKLKSEQHKLVQRGHVIESPHRWPDVRDHLVVAHGVIQAMIHEEEPPLRVEEITYKESVVDKGVKKIVSRRVIDGPYDIWDDPEVDEDWRQAYIADAGLKNNHLEAQRLLNARDNAHRYIWGKIGGQVIRGVTKGLMGKRPSYRRDPNWVGLENVQLSTMGLIVAKDPRFVSGNVMHMAEVSRKRRLARLERIARIEKAARTRRAA